jgi:hypothetical protein
MEYGKSSDGFTVKVNNEKLTIEIPIENLIYGFNHGREDEYGAKVIPGKEIAFAEQFADYLLDDCDAESGNNYIADMFNRLCEEIYDYDRIPDKVVVWNDENIDENEDEE